MSAAAVVIIISRPTRPNKTAEEIRVEVLELDDSVPALLRRAATQIDTEDQYDPPQT